MQISSIFRLFIINDLHPLIYKDTDRLVSDDLIHLSEEGVALCADAIAETIRRVAAELGERRRSASRGLVKKVTETLAFLDMPKVRFDVGIKRSYDFCATGRDRVEFMISTNPGEPLMPMAKIASGGELARIMLSLKNVLNECDGINTVVFDEVDTGISGKTSRKVGIKLKEIG